MPVLGTEGDAVVAGDLGFSAAGDAVLSAVVADNEAILLDHRLTIRANDGTLPKCDAAMVFDLRTGTCGNGVVDTFAAPPIVGFR